MDCRILLVDDHEVVRSGLRAMLQSLDNVTICGESANGLDAIQRAHQLRPHIIIADPWLPGANGVILTRRILERHPDQRVLIFGLFESDSSVRSLLRAGIKGLVLKTDPAADILGAIEALQRNRTYFTSSVESAILGGYLHTAVPSVVPDQRSISLTLREQEVVQLLAEGRVTKEIGTIFGISFRTAATHRSNVMRKLGVHNIAEVTLYAISHHMIDAPTFRVLADVAEISRPALESAARAAA
jgi:DNA-binding NarL/FixJ family response regulator